MPDRKQDCVRLHFNMTKAMGKATCQAMCKKCGKEVQGLVTRIIKII